jgi:hypothetical protein
MDYVICPPESFSQFESAAIEKHYQSKKSMAIAYLMTVGSKALIVADAVNAENNPNLSIIESFDQESDIKRQIILDEAIRKFKTNFLSYPGILVFKKGRNGSIRRTYLLLCQSASGDFLVWKSKVVGQKTFKLNTLKNVETTKEGSGINSRSASREGPLPTNAPTNTSRATNKSKRKSSSLSTQFIRLRNQNRSLDLQFYSASDTSACLHLLGEYIEANHQSNNNNVN